MIDNHFIRSKLYEEFTSDERKLWFDYKQKKYFHHLDNIYYSVSLKNDYVGCTPKGIMQLTQVLELYRENIISENEKSLWFIKEDDILYSRGGYALYKYHLSVNGICDIYLLQNLPNNSTPRIVVQLRSEGLWQLGEIRALVKSYEILNRVLREYDIEIHEIKENRIDYAYHTNCIQNPIAFYGDKSLIKNLSSPLKSWSKYGNRSDGSLNLETFTLGNRSSNNVYFRTYDKVSEVLNKSHKFWFLEIWLSQGIITNYDYYVYTYCAVNKHKYDAIEWGMLAFYVEYGKNDFLVRKFKKVINDPNTNVTYIRSLIKGILPRPTMVFNIEFQTMRKFYSNSDFMIHTLPFKSDLPYTYLNLDPLVKLFQILDNRSVFLDYLTSKTVSFKRDIKVKYPKGTKDSVIYLDFWYRLRCCKLNKITNVDLKRFYKKDKVDIERIYKDLKKNIARIAITNGDYDSDINDDLSLALNMLNDNDYVIDDEGLYKIIDMEYVKFKEKIKKAYKSPLDNGTSKDLLNDFAML